METDEGAITVTTTTTEEVITMVTGKIVVVTGKIIVVTGKITVVTENMAVVVITKVITMTTGVMGDIETEIKDDLNFFFYIWFHLFQPISYIYRCGGGGDL